MNSTYNTTWYEEMNLHAKEQALNSLLDLISGLDPSEQNWVLSMAKEHLIKQREEYIESLEEQIKKIRITLK